MNFIKRFFKRRKNLKNLDYYTDPISVYHVDWVLVPGIYKYYANSNTYVEYQAKDVNKMPVSAIFVRIPIEVLDIRVTKGEE